MSVIEKVTAFFSKLPFKGMMEKIPTETRTKVPVLNKVIPFANQIVCGLVLILAVTIIIACSSKSGGKSKIKVSPVKDFKYEWTADRKGICVTAYTGKDANVRVPATIEGLPVVELGSPNELFKTIPIEGFQYIGEIVLPDSITVIKEDAFFGSLFYKITLPKGLKEIPKGAFMGCKNFSAITLPDGIEKIGNTAFSACSDLRVANLPASLKEIGYEAFYNCTELNNLIIPDSLSTVKFSLNILKKSYAFRGCDKLPLNTRSRLEALGYKDES